MSGRESNYASWLAKAEHDLLNVQNNLLAAPERVPYLLLDTEGADARSSPKGASYLSPGQRPGSQNLPVCLRALKGRNTNLGRAPMVADP
jgi:hypothetical protein